MATKQYVEERIANAEMQIQKKEALIKKMSDRIQKNTEKLMKFGYTAQQIAEGIDNPFRMDRSNPNFDKAFDLCYSISNAQESIDNAEKALVELREKLTKYQSELAVIIEKENSRNIPVIIEFLNNWKNNVKSFYEDSFPKWVEARSRYSEADHAYWNEFNNGEWRRTGDKTLLNRLRKERDNKKADRMRWSFLDSYIIGHANISLNYAKIKRDLDHEANMKYDFIIERTNAIVGQITDASYLTIGEKGDLNGIIHGTKGSANVYTIGAGGYNIQCFHFRTLISEWKR